MGRPKGSLNKATADVKAAAQVYAPAALKELARLATRAESEAARVAACKELLDRAYGKSPQSVTMAATVTTKAQEEVRSLPKPKRDELRKLLQ